MNHITLYAFSLVLMTSLHLVSVVGRALKEEQISAMDAKVEYGLEETTPMEKTWKKRQIYYPYGTQNVQNVFGNMCGVMVYCTNPGGVTTYDYYDYGFGVFGGFTGLGNFMFSGFSGPARPFSFFGGGFFG